jgi:hypothetical protein
LLRSKIAQLSKNINQLQLLKINLLSLSSRSQVTLNHVIDHSYEIRKGLINGVNKFRIDNEGNFFINDIIATNGKIFTNNGGIIGFWSPNSETYKSADKEKDKFLDLDDWQKSYPIKENFDSFIESNKVTDKNRLRNELEILTSESDRLKEDKVIVYFYKQMQVKVNNITSLSYYPTKSRGKHSMKNGLWWRVVTNSDFDIIEFIKFYKEFWNITGNFDFYIEIGGGIGGYNHD